MKEMAGCSLMLISFGFFCVLLAVLFLGWVAQEILAFA